MAHNDRFHLSHVPWSRKPGLKEMTDDVGIDFDRFIDALKEDKTDIEMAAEFNVSEKLVYHLREHFFTHGVGSIEGGD
ncbi:MAG: helix-turn-helix domain-containing protein [Desulfotomaculaceae bacterium]|nr:helix-turn-helix domain-containing protein [Desulfotomaculaceae bacterium]